MVTPIGREHPLALLRATLDAAPTRTLPKDDEESIAAGCHALEVGAKYPVIESVNERRLWWFSARAAEDMNELSPAVRLRIHRALMKLLEEGKGRVFRISGARAEGCLMTSGYLICFRVEPSSDVAAVIRVLPGRGGSGERSSRGSHHR